MTARPAPPAARAAVLPVALAAAGFAALALGVVSGSTFTGVALAAAFGVGARLAFAPRISWFALLAALILLVLFVPIRRYQMTFSMPFELEPYRLLLLAIAAGWVLALLSDDRIRFRRTGFDGPVLVIVLATLASVALNPGRVAVLDTTIVKALTFFAGFMLVLYLIPSVVTRFADVERLIKILVAGGAVLALLAIAETLTGWTPFNSLGRLLPMQLDPDFGPALVRNGQQRAMGSAEHAIALGALLVLLVPLALHLTLRSSRVWLLALGPLTLGTLATISRTGVLMLLVVAVVYAVIRPRETLRLWPLLPVLLFATHAVMPGTLGTLRHSFSAESGIFNPEGTAGSAGRVQDVAPAMAQIKERPLFGHGYSTRVTAGPGAQDEILDNQWLVSGIEVGVAGVVGWLWLFGRFVRRCARVARRYDGDVPSLLGALAASSAAFAVGMLTFDAFSFVQVTLVLYLLLGVGAALLTSAEAAASASAASTRRFTRNGSPAAVALS